MALIKKGRISYIFLYVRDFERMVSFYRDTLGFQVRYTEPERCAFLTVPTSDMPQIALYPGRKTPSSTSDHWFFVIDVDDLDSVASRLLETRIAAEGIFEVPYGRALRVVDPEGNVIQIHQPK